MVIEIRLKDRENGTTKVVRSDFVSWVDMKRAVKLQTEMGKDGFTDIDRLDEIIDIVAGVFRGIATRQEIEDMADADEIIAAYMMIVSGVSQSAKQNFLRAVGRAAAQEEKI